MYGASISQPICYLSKAMSRVQHYECGWFQYTRQNMIVSQSVIEFRNGRETKFSILCGGEHMYKQFIWMSWIFKLRPGASIPHSFCLGRSVCLSKKFLKLIDQFHDNQSNTARAYCITMLVHFSFKLSNSSGHWNYRGCECFHITAKKSTLN